MHRVVEATGLGPVDVLASSGGAVAALPWLLSHPGDVTTEDYLDQPAPDPAAFAAKLREVLAASASRDDRRGSR